MTPTPVMLTVPIRARMASTAAPSPPFLSPRPTQRPAAIAAASVTRTSSRARLRSGAGRTPSKPALALGVRESGNDTGPPWGAGLCWDPRCMTTGPTDQQPLAGETEPEGAGAPATDRMARFTVVNMLRSLLPLVIIILVVVGWTAFRQNPDVDPVKP